MKGRRGKGGVREVREEEERKGGGGREEGRRMHLQC